MFADAFRENRISGVVLLNGRNCSAEATELIYSGAGDGFVIDRCGFAVAK